ncbi:MAG: transcription termination/antitermination protein NusA [Erysipelotrichaceae bacterium]|jgi:N utilization substance protein A|nr:transcription termination/antitermination protein NusA [Erysipelotrichaceae bacterium]
MQLKLKDILGALNAVEEEKNIPEDVILDALCEAMAKAYKKDAELSDIDVTAVINQKKQTIDLIQSFAVVEEVEDDELEISLEDAKQIDPNAEIGGKVSRPIEFTAMSRAAASLARNVMRQKIREAEKTAVYDEYVDKTNELVIGIVESVKDKFTLVNLGRTVAMMPKSAQIPTERLSEGQQIRVIITEVNKDTKGSQVLVSRADSMLVKRLFEREVPEIFSGVVEIKAIAREAGERTKMAVLSHNPDVDPIGACIGPRGGRVQEVIEELHGEKIDIFQWSDDLTELVKNALAPAEIEAVLPVEDDDNALLVIVNEDQLSLAIGKRGKNARLAVKLTNHKIDIKTRAEIEEMGMDYDKLVAEAESKKAEYHKEAEIKAVERKNTEAEEVQTRMQANAQKIAEAKAAQEELAESEDIVPDEMAESVSENLRTQMAMEPQEEEKNETEAPAQEEETETAEKEPAEEKPMENKADRKQTAKEVSNDKGTKHADLEELAAKNTYVSVFEKLASTSAPKPKTDVKFKRRKKKEDEEEFKVKNKDLEKQINTEKAAAKPVYTEEELAEIEAQQQKEENSEYDVDYDEYADYYKDEDNN